MKTMSMTKQPSVIMLTAFGQEDVTKKAVDLGASCFILKPFDMENLVGHIRQVSGNGTQVTHRSSSIQNSVLSNKPEPKRKNLDENFCTQRL
ncbi:sporulation transcription factor Spo0A [Bacillus safensis FO-36b] [Bacillus safensis subsp. safensis]